MRRSAARRLFCPSCGHRHDLHSFPTRRSSDLSSYRRIVFRARASGRSCTASHSLHPSTDRKSTRLNSSHSQISYAVFCLKKKSAGGEGHIAVLLDGEPAPGGDAADCELALPDL